MRQRDLPCLNVKQFTKLALGLVVTTLMLSACALPRSSAQLESVGVADARALGDSVSPMIRWGGTIAALENREDGVTVIEVVSRPLAYSGRPLRNDQSDGRFIAEVAEILDPEIVKPGRDITVTGQMVSLRAGSIGQSPYEFPVVQVQEYRYWPVVIAPRYARRFGHHCVDHPSYPAGFRRPSCRFLALHGPFGPYGKPHPYRGRGRVGISLILRP